MSRTNLFWILGISLLGLFAFSCTNEDDDPTPDDNVSETISGGDDWEITYYFDKDEEESDNFSGYSFRFNSDGTLEAIVNSSVVRTGNWSVNSSSTRFNIDLGAGEPLEDLNDDWLLMQETDNLLELHDDNDEHDEILRFER